MRFPPQKNVLCVLLACIGAAGCVSASAVDIVCPTTIESKQQSQSVGQWTPADLGAASVLDSVTLLSGAPAENASLVPDVSSKGKQLETIVWKLVRKPSEPIWIACTYSNTRIALTTQVPDGATECSVAYSLSPKGTRVKVATVQCK